MIWLWMVVLAVAIMAPLLWFVLRPLPAMRGRHDADMALYHAQLAELEQERSFGRLDEAQHKAAMLEVQRRLLASPTARTMAVGAAVANATADIGSGGGRAKKGALLLGMPVLVAVFGLGFYLYNGHPFLPSATFAERQAAAAQDDSLINQLRARVESMPPDGEATRQGWVLLGQAEANRGRSDAALDAWQRAETIRFDPELAAAMIEMRIQNNQNDAAEAMLQHYLPMAQNDPRLQYLAGLMELKQGRPRMAKMVWQQLLASAPADAPWRAGLEKAIANLN